MSKSQIYEVDKIVGMKEENGVKVFKIHWLGYPSSEDSWEPQHYLLNCQSLIDEYIKSAATPSPMKTRSGALVSSDEEDATDTPRRRPVKKQSSASRKRAVPIRSSIPRATVIKSPSRTSGVTTPQTTPTRRYNFRPSTIQSHLLSSDDESSPIKRLGRRDLHIPKVLVLTKQQKSVVPPPEPPKSQEKEQPSSERKVSKPKRDYAPKWMQLGFLEVFYCFLLLGAAGAMLWYYFHCNKQENED